MAAIIVCDGCGKQAPGVSYAQAWHKPAQWFERGDEDGTQTACSRECIERIAKATGKTGLVLPL